MSESIINTPSLTIPVDSEHGALRLSVVGIFVGIWLVIFAVSNRLVTSEGFNLIAFFLAFVVAGVATRVSEQYLQKRWPSGRVVEMNADSIEVRSKTKVQDKIDAREPFSVLLWRFQTKKRSRVPKGWFVIACALEQDDTYLSVYTFASPTDAEMLQKQFKFTTLASEKNANAKDVRQDSLRFAGEQRRLKLAETFRWNSGAEMSMADFETFLNRLNGQFSQWMPSNR
ncbi:MAG: hypothetical protein ABI690_02445 [Chloroflexota bacterium]